MQLQLPVWLALTAIVARLTFAHGTPTPLPVGPLHVKGAAIFDLTGQAILLRGVEMPGLNIANPTAEQSQTVAAMNSITFGVLRFRWNINTLRLPVSNAIWRRDGQAYLDRVGKIVRAATAYGLIVVISDCEDPTAGETSGLGLPTQDSIAFWKNWGTFFKDDPHVIFGAFNEPSARLTPGAVAGRRGSADWQFWLQGGTTSSGQAVTGMKALVEAIRSTGAEQIISISSYFDTLDFQGFGSDFFLTDPNVIYEVHPFFDHALTDAQRDTNFGFLARSVPIYAGRWGLDLTGDQPSCRSVPQDPQAATALLFQTFDYFDSKTISWTNSSFEPHILVQDLSSYEPTTLDRNWTCGTITNPEPGMGEALLLALTEDETGFGVLDAQLTASAAGGPAGPIAPGEIVDFYGYLFGPANSTVAAFDSSGKLPAILDRVRILFDGEAAPLFATGPYLITAQVPYSAQGKNHVNVQLFYQDIPSNIIQLAVLDAMPGIVTTLGTNEAVAANQDGSLNSTTMPAAPGSIVVLYATGYGQTSPPGVNGRPSQIPEAQPAQPVSLSIDGNPAEILYAAEAPGFVGLLQIDARVPGAASGSKPRAVPVLLRVGIQSSIAGVTIWVL
ncbi:MAG TPA: cellulase family glycosylhydrolase [Bryobacteraceae bacterium]|nr:cellulase family glycosylhydrolase [Bryobacteraceae bacterium]